MSRPIQATIDLAALRRNHAAARAAAGNACIMSVVKADAYGHGLARVARALDDCTDGYALIEVEAAIALREAGHAQPLLLLEGYYRSEEIPLYGEYGLTPVLHNLEQVAMLEKAAGPLHLPIYLKLNCGMNRLGFDHEEARAAIARLTRLPAVATISLMTHFSDADTRLGIAEQLARFSACRREIDPQGRHPISVANSATLLRYPEARGDWVRPGIMLYGSSPFPEEQSAAALGLAPVMTLESELIAVRRLAAGERVGYGGIFRADSAMTIGVVACGYGDGYPRHAPTGSPVLVEGTRTRTLGRVSMDKICVDLTGIPQARIGSRVVLWGEGLAADEVAAAAGTISYELFCAVAPRVRMVER